MENEILKMGEKNLVRISNVLNLTRQEFNAIEKHIFLITLLNLKDQQGFNLDLEDDMVNIEIQFPASELKETNRERIKEALDKITNRKIFFESTTKNKDYFSFVVPFSYANYTAVNGAGSTITIMLNSKCKKLFLELANGYTSTDLKAILNLKSTYSIRMYELISMYQNQGSWTVSIENLKNLLGLEYDSYKSFTDFEKRVLFYSQKELWEHCELYFEWRIAKKERKKITALTFEIKKKEKQERVNLNEEIKETIDFIATLSPADIAQKINMASQKYTLTREQIDYIIFDKNVFNEFIRIDLIIESMISKGKPPKDRTAYMAHSLGLDKVKFSKSQSKSKKQ